MWLSNLAQSLSALELAIVTTFHLHRSYHTAVRSFAWESTAISEKQAQTCVHPTRNNGKMTSFVAFWTMLAHFGPIPGRPRILHWSLAVSLVRLDAKTNHLWIPRKMLKGFGHCCQGLCRETRGVPTCMEWFILTALHKTAPPTPPRRKSRNTNDQQELCVPCQVTFSAPSGSWLFLMRECA